MGKMIIAASGKGGTGKTTFTSQVGPMLASLGYLTVLVDADAGFRNLDIALGLESSVVYDYSDYMNERAELDDVLIKSPDHENLYFVAAPQSAVTSEFDADRTEQFWESLKSRFDFVIADAPAGMGDGFSFAAGCADEAVIVSLAEAASLRDADRVTEELENIGVGTIRLVLNRIQPQLVTNKILMNVDDCIDILSIPILGIVPEDGSVITAASSGKAIDNTDSGAGRAFLNIAKRLTGESVRIMDFNEKKGFLKSVRKALFKG